VLTVFMGPFVGVEFPLTIIQLLWINIIMDTLAAIAFGGEPALEQVMREQPIKRTENIVSKYMATSILSSGIYIAAAAVFFLSFPPIKELFMRNGVPDNFVFLSAFFNLFIFLIVFNGFNARTEKLNLFDNLSHNPVFIQIIAFIILLQVTLTFVGGAVLRTTPLELMEWFYVIAFALTIIPLDIVRKMIIRASSKSMVGV